MDLNKSNFKKIILIITYVIFLSWALFNFSSLFTFLKTIVGYLLPFIIGLAIAFIVNIPMRQIEKGLSHIKFKNKKKDKVYHIHPKVLRAISLLLTIILIFAVIFLVVLTIVPQLSSTIGTLKDEVLPPFIDNAISFGKELPDKISDVIPNLGEKLESLNIDWNKIRTNLTTMAQNFGSNILNSSFKFATGVFSGLVNTFIAVVFAIYVLISKDTLVSQGKRTLRALLKKDRAEKVINLLSFSEKTFSGFFTGQFTEAIILGLLFFVGMSIFKFPYALMISVTIGFTALIPIVGAIIGCAVGIFLILVVNPIKALWFILFFFVVQQIEGNLIYPKVVGNSVGLPSMWVLLAVTVGGNVMGIPGMILFIPIASILYSLMKDLVHKRLKAKEISEMSSSSTDAYVTVTDETVPDDGTADCKDDNK